MSLLESATDDSIIFFQNDFSSNSFPIFEALKRSGEFCDVTLKVEDHCFKAHKIILAGTIPYFEKMFTINMKEKTQKVIQMKEIDPDFTGAATLFNKLYVCGGAVYQSLLNTVESYDPEKNVWSIVTSMSTGRDYHGVVAFEDHIYALGGMDESSSTLDSVERYSLLTGKWVYIPPMLTKRCRLGVATLNGHIYVCGGEDGTTYHQTSEVYNSSTKQWSYIASMNVKRSGVALVANCGKLFAIGGYDGRQCLNSVEVYDPELNLWDFVESMCARRGSVAAGVIPSL